MGYYIELVRPPNAGEAVTQEEAVALIDADPDLTWAENGPAEGLMARLPDDDSFLWIEEGTVRSKSPSRQLLGKLIELATQLRASVVGEDGQVIESMDFDEVHAAVADEQVREAIEVLKKGEDDQGLALHVLDQCLYHGSEEDKNALVSALGGLLHSAYELSTRRTAASLLVGEATCAVLPNLIDALNDPHHQVRTLSVQAIAGLGPKARAALPALRRLESDPHYGPKYAALDAVKKLSAAD